MTEFIRPPSFVFRQQRHVMLTNLTPTPQIENFLADWTYGMQRSVLREMIAVVSRPGILSFAGGLPAPELFPSEQFAEAMSQVLLADKRSLQYGPPLPALKAHIVGLMAQRGVTCDEEQVFITTGAQQGLAVLTTMLLNPAGQVMLEEIIYAGMQQTIAPYKPDILSVPTDLTTGMDVDVVEQHLADGARPAFLYTVPESHNPLGVSMSLAKRQRLAELAYTYQLPILEDDAYGFLSYEDTMLPPIRALNEDWVFYLGSFSKIIGPALRLGWMVAPKALVPKLTVVKEAYDLETSALIQRAVSAFLDAGHLPGHIDKLRQTYKERRDVMLHWLGACLSGDVRWTLPAGGMFVWVELPRHVDTAKLLEVAVEQEQVAFIPGHAFALPGVEARHCLRLNFSNARPGDIQDGIQRLARIINQTI